MKSYKVSATAEAALYVNVLVEAENEEEAEKIGQARIDELISNFENKEDENYDEEITSENFYFIDVCDINNVEEIDQ